MSIEPLLGRPGVTAARTASYRNVLRSRANAKHYPGGGVIDGAARDPDNADNLRLLRSGLLLGRASSKRWLHAIMGLTDVAYTSGTSLSLAEAAGDELVRRIGPSGTFTLTGPPTTGGTVRSMQATYSAVAAAGSGHRVVTITALGANQVEQINFNAASTAGNLQLRVQKPDGSYITTGNAAWNATDATYLANINTALDTATGVVGGIVASAIPATDPDLGICLTYSGAGYAGLPWAPAQVALFPTSSTAAVYTPITAAVDGRFISGSFVQAEDGSEIPRAVIDDGTGLQVPADGSAVDFPHLLVGGDLHSERIINWPSDVALRAWIVDRLNENGFGRFTFSHLLGAA